MTDLDLDAIRRRRQSLAEANGDHGPRAIRLMHTDVPLLLAEVERLRDMNGKLALTIQACPEGHHDANLAHARAERDQLRAEVERLRREQSVELANAEARADVLAEKVARLEAQLTEARSICDQAQRLATQRFDESLEARQAVVRLEANQVPDGGEWRTEYGHRSGLGQQMGDWTPHMPPDEEGRSYCVANGCEERRVWIGHAQPIGPVSNSEPRSEVDPDNDTQTPHTAV